MGPSQFIDSHPSGVTASGIGDGHPSDQAEEHAGRRAGENLTASDRQTLRTASSLLAAGLISPTAVAGTEATEARYAVAISPAMRALIQTPDDPIGRQFIPDVAELTTAPHERSDPIGDDALSPVKGVVYRYEDRALLKPLLVCPVYCRFCFRRQHVGPDGGVLTDAELQAAYAWFEAHPQVSEVILTGGDPLMLSPRRLGAIVAALSAMPHIQTIRIHSRVPVADPDRLTDALTAAMDTDRSLWLVVHANHATEFTAPAGQALKRLRVRGIPLLGQSVLLRGVNDSSAALEALFRAMIAHRIKPYYLHQLDPAPGTARFHVPIEEGRALLETLRGRVTGLAWPTYVLDIPGGHGKVPIGPDYRQPDGSFRDPYGRVHQVVDFVTPAQSTPAAAPPAYPAG
jgi:lysine 2,3-aminomutase